MMSRCQVFRQVRPTVSVYRLSMRLEWAVPPCPLSQSQLRLNQVSYHGSRYVGGAGPKIQYTGVGKSIHTLNENIGTTLISVKYEAGARRELA